MKLRLDTFTFSEDALYANGRRDNVSTVRAHLTQLVNAQLAELAKAGRRRRDEGKLRRLEQLESEAAALRQEIGADS